MQTQLDRCWLLAGDPPIFILGGRYGDIILLSGCLHDIHKRTGLKPIMITSERYASIYEGMSYVRSHPVRKDWWECIGEAKTLAEQYYGSGTVVQFWHDTPKHDDTIGFEGRNWVILQSHGRNWGVNTALDPDFGTSMARRMGYSREQWLSLLPVFDRRNSEREEALIKRYLRGDKPLILYNFTGVSSPFGWQPELMRLFQPFKKDFQLLDIGPIRAIRIFDLLGLYDKAVGILTSDTSTAHLAPASPVPAIWFTVTGWGKSIPRGNVALHVPYDQVPQRLNEVAKVMDGWRK